MEVYIDKKRAIENIEWVVKNNTSLCKGNGEDPVQRFKEYINKRLVDCVEYLDNNLDSCSTFTSTGGLTLLVTREDDNYYAADVLVDAARYSGFAGKDYKWKEVCAGVL